MKNPISYKITYLLIFIFILYFAAAFQAYCVISNDQERRDDRISYLVTSSSFVVSWNRTWGDYLTDSAAGVIVNPSDNIYLAGNSYSYGVVLVKYDEYGVQQWNRTWGGINDARICGVAMDSSNNIYLAGEAQIPDYDMILVKYNSSGIQQWNRTWGGNDYDWSFGVAVDSSDNIYLGGIKSFTLEPNGTEDIILVKYDNSGIQQWNRTWGGSSYEDGYAIAVDSSDNAYIIGCTASYGAGFIEAALVKYDSSGVLQWNRTWGGNSYYEAHGVAIDPSDNIYVVGDIYDYGTGDFNFFLVKYDSTGLQQWNRTWGGSDYDTGSAVAIDSYDTVYVAGATGDYVSEESFDIVLLQYDSSGVLQWDQTLGGDGSDFCSAITLHSSDIPILAGMTTSYHNEPEYLEDMFLVKFVPDIYTPIITIINPLPNEIFYEAAPNFNLSIVEPNLESMWYTLDSGRSNHQITELSGTIKQSVWNAAPSGKVIIEFWAKDFEGYMGHSEVVVEKDWVSIPGYNPLFLISAVSIITVSSLKKLKKSIF